jgi:hypothetical protein
MLEQQEQIRDAVRTAFFDQLTLKLQRRVIRNGSETADL